MDSCFDATYSHVILCTDFWNCNGVFASVANLVIEDVQERALRMFDMQTPLLKEVRRRNLPPSAYKNRLQDLLQHLIGIEESINFTVRAVHKFSIWGGNVIS